MYMLKYTNSGEPGGIFVNWVRQRVLRYVTIGKYLVGPHQNLKLLFKDTVKRIQRQMKTQRKCLLIMYLKKDL